MSDRQNRIRKENSWCDWLCQESKTELENKIPDANNLATKTALTAIENKIPSVCNIKKNRLWHKKN